MPTVTERRSEAASDTMRTPFPSRLARIPSVGTLSERFLPRQADLPGLVDLEHLHVDDVALADDVGHLPYPLRSELRDVHQPVGAGQDLHEGAEVDHPAHGAPVDLADLGLRGEPADAVDGLLHGLAV